jgi:hypothetical protein
MEKRRFSDQTSTGGCRDARANYTDESSHTRITHACRAHTHTHMCRVSPPQITMHSHVWGVVDIDSAHHWKRVSLMVIHHRWSLVLLCQFVHVVCFSISRIHRNGKEEQGEASLEPLLKPQNAQKHRQGTGKRCRALINARNHVFTLYVYSHTSMDAVHET